MMEKPTAISDGDRVVGEWLEALRVSRVMSLPQLAGQAGIDDEWLAALERGWGSATLTELARLGDVLGTDLLTILLPALAHNVVLPVDLPEKTSWALQLNRCVHGIQDARAQTLLLNFAAALRDRE